jgi:predicted NAD/FAD-dependent oxidoreductase
MKMKLDENIGQRGKTLLIEAGHDVCTVLEQNLEQILRIWTQGIHRLSADGVLQPPVKFAPYYAAPAGANAIARYLGQNLEIIKGQAITTISPMGNGWQLSSADGQ